MCTGNVARGPLAAALLGELARAAGAADRYVARAVGTAAWAPRRLTTRELAWADVVAVMEERHLAEVRRLLADRVGTLLQALEAAAGGS